MSHQNNGARASLLAVITISVAGTALSCSASFAQESTELAFILSCNPIGDAPRVDRARAHFEPFHVRGIKQIPPAPFYKGGVRGLSLFPKGGIKLLLIGAIRFYQLFISPQDMPACNFVTSCSQFGAEAIRRLGVVRGILLTSDRLQRCNSMSVSRYHTDYKSGKFVDPVQVYVEMLR